MADMILVMDPWYSDEYCLLEDNEPNRRLIEECQREYGTPIPNWTPTPGKQPEGYAKAAKEAWPATHRLFDSGEFEWKPLPVAKGTPIHLNDAVYTVVLLCNEW